MPTGTDITSYKILHRSKESMDQPKTSIYTSDSSISWNNNYKPDGTAIIVLGKISSAIITKGEDPHGLGRWTTVTLLGKQNFRTSVFNMYRPGDTSIENSGPNTVIKQQWLLLQQQNRINIHPHDAAINDLIIAVKGQQKHHHDIVVTTVSYTHLTLPTI